MTFFLLCTYVCVCALNQIIRKHNMTERNRLSNYTFLIEMIQLVSLTMGDMNICFFLLPMLHLAKQTNSRYGDTLDKWPSNLVHVVM